MNLPAGCEVVARTEPSPASLSDWTLCPRPGGGQLLLITFRRDRFFLVVDLQSATVTQHGLSGQPWTTTTGPDGCAYMGTSQSPGARLVRYDPRTQQVEDLGDAFGQEILYWLEAGPDGKLYGGTYPNALLIRYERATGMLANLGSVDTAQKYNLFGGIGADGRIYCGLGMTEQQVIEYDPVTGAKRDLWPAAWKTTNAPRVYRGEDGAVYAYPGLPTPASTGKALRIRPGGQVDQVTRPARQAMGCAPPSHVARPTLRDGRILAEVTPERVLLRTSGPVPTEQIIPLGYGGGVKPIYSLGTGPGGTIAVTSKPTNVLLYNPENGETRTVTDRDTFGAQVDSLCAAAGKLVMGTYGHAELHLWEPGKAVRTLGPIGAMQDRPRAMVAAGDGHVYIASAPAYGEHGGALTELDAATEKWTTTRNVVSQQSLQCLALGPDGKRLFLGSSIHGGSGSTPQTHEAVVAAWDLATRRVLWTLAPIPGTAEIAALCALPAGALVYGMTRDGDWFGIHPDTAQVAFRIKPGLGPPPHLAALARDPQRGLVYGILGRTLFRVDERIPERVDAVVVFPGEEPITTGPVLDERGAVFVAIGNALVRWTPSVH